MSGFNGAGVLRPRKLQKFRETAGHPLCFNGAGVLRPRKYWEAARLTAGSLKLQWGRGFKTPEIGVGTEQIFAITPLQWGRGFKTPEMRWQRPVSI